MKIWLPAASLGLAIAAAIFALNWPMYAAFGLDGSITKRATLVEVNGAWSFLPVSLPVIIAIAAVVFANRAVRIVAAVLMSAFALLGGMTIGLYYLPAAIVMVVAACVPETRPEGFARTNR
jgi:hypothetical protein